MESFIAIEPCFKQLTKNIADELSQVKSYTYINDSLDLGKHFPDRRIPKQHIK